MTATVRKWQTPTQADLLAAARKQFMHGERIDLPVLADELGISRATAYRWVGNVEQLTADVITSLVADTFERVREETRNLKGARRVLEIIERCMRYTAAFKPLCQFLDRDPQKSLRLITSRESPVQQFTIAQHEQVLEEEEQRGTLRLPVDAHTMAYAITRIGESFLYADLIAGEKPDVDKAMTILRLMIRADSE
jgi:AcrR family transcriptional regulator